MFSTGMAHRAISVRLGRWRTYSCTAASRVRSRVACWLRPRHDSRESGAATERSTPHSAERLCWPVAVAAGVDPHTVHVVPNFLSADELTDPVTALEEEPRFFFAGGLRRSRAYATCSTYTPPIGPAGTLVLAGAGESSKRGHSRSRALPHDRILGPSQPRRGAGAASAIASFSHARTMAREQPYEPAGGARWGCRSSARKWRLARDGRPRC